MSSPSVVYSFSFLLAFCSLFYELVYAEILSVCLGGTKIQYITTIALFTCALGFGSILFSRVTRNRNLRKVFFTAEALLMILGSAGPFFITWILQPGGIEALAPVKVFVSYSVIFMIGFLSGFELPSLFSLRENAEGKILAADYLGMLVASVSFPLFFLPTFGTAASTLLVALVNGSALIWLRSDSPRLTPSVLWAVVIAGAMVAVAVSRASLNDFLTLLYLGGS